MNDSTELDAFQQQKSFTKKNATPTCSIYFLLMNIIYIVSHFSKVKYSAKVRNKAKMFYKAKIIKTG
jgi:hypothetical protein